VPMEITIKTHPPEINGIMQLVEATKIFPYLTFVGEKSWQSFDGYYCAYRDQSFAGVLAVNRIGGWVKLGPLAVLPEHQGYSIATKLIQQAVSSEKDNIYLASANPSVWKIAQRLGFQESFTWANLPLAVRMIYFKMSIRVLLCGESLHFIKEVLRKQRIANVHGHQHFVYSGVQYNSRSCIINTC